MEHVKPSKSLGSIPSCVSIQEGQTFLRCNEGRMTREHAGIQTWAAMAIYNAHKTTLLHEPALSSEYCFAAALKPITPAHHSNSCRIMSLRFH